MTQQKTVLVWEGVRIVKGVRFHFRVRAPETADGSRPTVNPYAGAVLRLERVLETMHNNLRVRFFDSKADRLVIIVSASSVKQIQAEIEKVDRQRA